MHCSQAVHYVFKRYEPRLPSAHIFLLTVPPSFLSVFLRPYYGNLGSFAVSQTLFLAVLSTSVVLYRLSPFHPLAQYPGPLLNKISRLSIAPVVLKGKRHIHIKELHQKYGDIVRVGESNFTCRSSRTK